MPSENRVIAPEGALWIDGISAGKVSVATYAAFRQLYKAENRSVQSSSDELYSRTMKVMARLMYVDRIRYTDFIDVTDIIAERDRNSLEIYLLCTCLDTLAGQEDYCDAQKWLMMSSKAKNDKFRGIKDKFQTIRELEGLAFSESDFQKTIGKLLEIYNNSYGVNSHILSLVRSLPLKIKERIASMYVIHKKGADVEQWDNKSIDDKLKEIFIEYIFITRRNKYTHTSQSFEYFGGVAAFRRALSTGVNYAPPPTTIEIQQKKSILSVTCNYGDEALFLREVILACIAQQYNVLDDNWINRYQKAERLRRRVLALQYELEYNLNVLQSHFGVLSNSFLLRDVLHPIPLGSLFASGVYHKKRGYSLPFAFPFLSLYLEAVDSFNRNIKKRPDKVTAICAETSIVWKLQKMREICEELLQDYPKWAYKKDYIIHV